MMGWPFRYPFFPGHGGPGGARAGVGNYVGNCFWGACGAITGMERFPESVAYPIRQFEGSFATVRVAPNLAPRERLWKNGGWTILLRASDLPRYTDAYFSGPLRSGHRCLAGVAADAPR